MSKFTPTVKFEIEFDGDTISMDLRRLKNDHMIKLSQYFSPDSKDIGLTRTVKIIKEAKEVFTDCVINFQGLKDASGNLLSLDSIFDELYFTQIFDEILGKLIHISVLSGIDAKKSVKPLLEELSEESAAGT